MEPSTPAAPAANSTSAAAAAPDVNITANSTSAAAAAPDVNITTKCRGCDATHPLHDPKYQPSNPGKGGFLSMQCLACRSGYHAKCADVKSNFVCPACKADPRWVGSKYFMDNVFPGKLSAMRRNQYPKVKFAESTGKAYTSSVYGILKVADGNALHRVYDINGPCTIAYLVDNTDGLDMKMMDKATGFPEIFDILQKDPTKEKVRVIDVYDQNAVDMELKEFKECLKNRKKVLNILSIEIGETALGDLISSPKLYKMSSLEELFWPVTEDDDGQKSRRKANIGQTGKRRYHKDRPRVEMFCLMGMGGSFTTWHVDFGGASVWFHVLKGRKVFFVAPPTKENLNRFQQHEANHTKFSSHFLGDELESIWTVEITAGQTLFLPSGWIHAVWTPEDTIAFSGNYLTLNEIPMQCEINAMELRQNVKAFNTKATTYLFPSFKEVNWRAAQVLIAKLTDEGDHLPVHLIEGALALVDHFSLWLKMGGARKKMIDEENVVDIFNRLKEVAERVATSRKVLPVGDLMDRETKMVAGTKKRKLAKPSDRSTLIIKKHKEEEGASEEPTDHSDMTDQNDAADGSEDEDDDERGYEQDEEWCRLDKMLGANERAERATTSVSTQTEEYIEPNVLDIAEREKRLAEGERELRRGQRELLDFQNKFHDERTEFEEKKDQFDKEYAEFRKKEIALDAKEKTVEQKDKDVQELNEAFEMDAEERVSRIMKEERNAMRNTKTRLEKKVKDVDEREKELNKRKEEQEKSERKFAKKVEAETNKQRELKEKEKTLNEFMKKLDKRDIKASAKEEELNERSKFLDEEALKLEKKETDVIDREEAVKQTEHEVTDYEIKMQAELNERMSNLNVREKKLEAEKKEMQESKDKVVADESDLERRKNEFEERVKQLKEKQEAIKNLNFDV